ncbi:hypothetical protein ACULNC_27080 [Shigella flexneri]
MALSACFRQQLNPVVNSLLKERIIHSPKELEHDNAVIRVLQKLQIQEVCNNTLWETAKQQLLQKSDGRYFAINSKHLSFPGQENLTPSVASNTKMQLALTETMPNPIDPLPTLSL